MVNQWCSASPVKARLARIKLDYLVSDNNTATQGKICPPASFQHNTPGKAPSVACKQPRNSANSCTDAC
jgi:hypothetical protein